MRERFNWGFWFTWLMATATGWVLGRFLVPNLSLVTTGLAIGILQWFSLSFHYKQAWHWILFTTLGWALGAALILFLVPAHGTDGSTRDVDFLAGVVTGVTVGCAQWLFLRTRLQLAGWWIPINIVAWTTGFAFLSGLLLTGVSVGLITATALMLLMLEAAK